MFQILPRVQPAPLSQQHTPAAKGSLLRFGKIAPKHAPAFFNKYTDEINEFPDLQKYGKIDLSDIYTKRLSSVSQDQFEQVCKGIAPYELRAMRQKAIQGKPVLGPIEESADMFFELYTLHALREKVITAEKVDRWRKVFLPEPGKRKELDFKQFLSQVGQEIPPDTVEAFQKMTGWDKEKSRTLLNLMAAKFILMRARDPKYDIWQKTVNLLKDEAGELNETIPWYSPKRLQVWFLAVVYTHVPSLPMEWFRTALVNIVSNQVKAPVQYKDLMENVYQKQFRRQEFDYLNPQFNSNNDRKRYLKGIELVNEAFILKNTRLWHPKEVSVGQ